MKSCRSFRVEEVIGFISSINHVETNSSQEVLLVHNVPPTSKIVSVKHVGFAFNSLGFTHRRCLSGKLLRVGVSYVGVSHRLFVGHPSFSQGFVWSVSNRALQWLFPHANETVNARARSGPVGPDWEVI